MAIFFLHRIPTCLAASAEIDISDKLDRMLEDAAASHVHKVSAIEFGSAMGLRDQPILDQFQGESSACRWIVSSFLLGPPTRQDYYPDQATWSEVVSTTLRKAN